MFLYIVSKNFSIACSVDRFFLYAHTESGSGQHVLRYRLSCRIMAFLVILLRNGKLVNEPVIGVICVLSYLFWRGIMIDLFQTLWKLPVLKDQFIILVIIRSNMLRWCLTTVDGSRIRSTCCWFRFYYDFIDLFCR